MTRAELETAEQISRWVEKIGQCLGREGEKKKVWRSAARPYGCGSEPRSLPLSARLLPSQRYPSWQPQTPRPKTCFPENPTVQGELQAKKPRLLRFLQNVIYPGGTSSRPAKYLSFSTTHPATPSRLQSDRQRPLAPPGTSWKTVLVPLYLLLISLHALRGTHAQPDRPCPLSPAEIDYLVPPPATQRPRLAYAAATAG